MIITRNYKYHSSIIRVSNAILLRVDRVSDQHYVHDSRLNRTFAFNSVRYPTGFVQQRFRIGCHDDQVLHVPPREISVGFQGQRTEPGRYGSRGRRTYATREHNNIIVQLVQLAPRPMFL